MNETIQITTEFIRLDALLKLGGLPFERPAAQKQK